MESVLSNNIYVMIAEKKNDLWCAILLKYGVVGSYEHQRSELYDESVLTGKERNEAMNEMSSVAEKASS